MSACLVDGKLLLNRLPSDLPTQRKPMVDLAAMRAMDLGQTRKLPGGDNPGDHYRYRDAEMQALWETGIAETRTSVQGPGRTSRDERADPDIGHGGLGVAFLRAGEEVLFGDADADGLAASITDGLTIDGPVRPDSMAATACLPGDPPGAHERLFRWSEAMQAGAAKETLAPRLAVDDYVGSAQNGLNETAIMRAIVPDRPIAQASGGFGAPFHGIDVDADGLARTAEKDGLSAVIRSTSPTATRCRRCSPVSKRMCR